MAGTGKRADQRKTLVLNLRKVGINYFGKSKAIRRKQAPKLKEINLFQIEQDLHSFVRQGIAKHTSSGYEINLKGYKILGKGDIKTKVKIKASAASRSALDKLKGSLEIENKGKSDN